MVTQTITPGTNNPRCLGNINLTLWSIGTDVFFENVDSSSQKLMWLTLYKTTFKIKSSSVTTTPVTPSKGPQTVPWAESCQKEAAWAKQHMKINPSRSQNWIGGESHHEHCSPLSKNLMTVIVQLYLLWARRDKLSTWKPKRSPEGQAQAQRKDTRVVFF